MSNNYLVKPCSKLWTDINIYMANKKITNCCRRLDIDPYTTEDLEINGKEIFANGPTTEKARQEWTETGTYPNGCEACSLNHPNGQYATWNKWIDKKEKFFKKTLTKHNVNRIEINLGTLCNMTCLYCGIGASSQWAKVLGVPAIDTDEKWKRLALDNLYKYIEEDTKDISTMQYSFLGGEPMLMPELFEVIEKLVDVQSKRPHQKVRLHFVSNLNVGPSVIEKFLKLCEPCKNMTVCVSASLDNIGTRAEALRQGLDFSRFDKNFETLNSSSVVNELAFLPTLCALSIANHPEFLSYAMDKVSKHRKISDFGNNWWIVTNLLASPMHLHAGILPEKYKKNIKDSIEIIESMRSNNTNNNNMIDLYIKHMNSVANLISTRRSEEYLTNALETYRKQQDIFKKNYWEIFPELNDIFVDIT